MSRKKYLYEIDGVISSIHMNGNAEIEFSLNNVGEYALLKKGHFYYNGRLVPENVPLSKYIRINMAVKFSCHALNRREAVSDLNPYYFGTSWYVMTCWIDTQNLLHNKVSVCMGMYSVSCSVDKAGNRRGVITTIDAKNHEQRIEIFASKFYLHGKRFSSSKMLSSVLNKDDKLFCDAVPCIEEESRDQCGWFATCGFQGQRPSVESLPDRLNYFQANCPVQSNRNASEQGSNGHDGETHEDRLTQLLQQSTTKNCFQSQLVNVINHHTSNSRTLFTSGYGFILDVLNDEFAILLGCFKLNVFQTILFHRRNAFLFKSSLATSKLSEIFVEGDYLRFIAVGAPPNFLTAWIAVQVSVPDIDDISDKQNSRNLGHRQAPLLLDVFLSATITVILIYILTSKNL